MNVRKPYAVIAVITAALGAVLVASSARAAIITPTVLAFSSEYSSGGDDRLAVNTVNGSGLVAGLHDANVQHMWLATDATPADTSITWDLGQSLVLTGFHLWNYNGSGEPTRETQTVDMQVSNAASFPAGPGTVDLGTKTFAPAPADGTTTAGEIQLIAATGQYVRFSNFTSYGSVDWVGLSEIRFIDNVVPEPSTVMLLGMGGFLLWLRRRNR